MIKVTCENYEAYVEVNGSAKYIHREALGLILEGFKIIRRIDNDLYEKTKVDIFVSIIEGKLDNFTDVSETQNAQEVRFDLNALLEQLKEEEGDN